MTKPHRRDPLLIGAVLAICLLALYLGAVQIARHREFGGLRHLANEIEQEPQGISEKIVEGLLPKAVSVMARGICQSEYIRAALTLVLANLDRQDVERDFERWSRAIELADYVATFAVSCSPTDGNFFVRLAMVKQAVIEQPEELARLIRFSQLYAPAEANAIAARYKLYNRLTPQTLALVEGEFASDLNVICQYKQGGFRRRLPAPNPRVNPRIADLVPGCTIGQVAATKSRR